MLSPQLRSRVFRLWSLFWSSGITNPLTSIEQITYLLFLKRLEVLNRARQEAGKRSLYGRRPNCGLQHHPDDSIGIDQSIPEDANPEDYKKCLGHGTCRWSYISKGQTTVDESGNDINTHGLLSQFVFPWLRVLDKTIHEMGNGVGANGGVTSARLEDAYFQLPAEKTLTLQEAIAAVDDLFQAVGTRSANSDIMGDIFEYLLSEIQSSGKNGQFRTPRHLIRFMIELLDPQPGLSIIDPAAGTSGFLINSIQHIMTKATPPENVVYEWDGTPHRNTGGLLTEQALDGQYFTGYDNDRTMVRIGWMNMILHGIEQPNIHLRDTLGKSLPDDQSASYDYALANPPYTGSIDTQDLHQTRFPKKSKRANKPELITNKTELLFVWLIIDLLKRGGRAAVIVPEGMLFGSTGAHKELRRQLLFEHDVEGVISLPGGVFQPYTGVKTSIIVFKRVWMGGDEPQRTRAEGPRTKTVWFYEVAEDGYTQGSNRQEQAEGKNDLWDALEKWKDRESSAASLDYFQPEVTPARWRLVDQAFLHVFPDLSHEEGQVRGIHELFRPLSIKPDEAEREIVTSTARMVRELYLRILWNAHGKDGILPSVPLSTRDKAVRELRATLNTQGEDILERARDDRKQDSEEHGRKSLAHAVDEFIRDWIKSPTEGEKEPEQRILDDLTDFGSFDMPESATTKVVIQALAADIVREFAKLDGYNVNLLVSREVRPTTEKLPSPKCWLIPVREWQQIDDWVSPTDETVKGSHDTTGKIRPEFLADNLIYNEDGTVKPEYLATGCIEADGLNLSAGRYKDELDSNLVTFEAPEVLVAQLIAIEQSITERLSSLKLLLRGEN